MPGFNRRVGLIALAALLAGLACSPTSLGLINPTPPSTPRPSRTPMPSPTPPPTPTPTPAPIVAGDLPEEVENRPGGYTIYLPAGWAAVELSENMLAAASSLDTLQAVLEDLALLPDSYALAMIESDALGAFEVPPPGAKDPLDLLTIEQANLEDEVMLDEPSTFEVDGYPAAGVEFAGYDADLGEVRGYVMGVVREDHKWGVRLIVVSPAEAWTVYAEAVKVMAEEMTFGEPTPPEPPPEGFLWQLQRRRGAEEGKFSELGGVAFGPDGRLYVADSDWGVWVLSHEGALLDRVWLDEFEHPSDVDAAPDGTLYVADSQANTVWIVGADGDLAGRLEAKREPYGEASPRRLAVGPDGGVAVIDENVDSNGDDYVRVMYFEPSGKLSWTVNLTAIQTQLESPSVAIGPEGEVYAVGQQGRGFILIDPEGEVLNPDIGNDVIYPVRARDIGVGPGGNVYLATWERGILQLGPLGEELGAYGIPVGGSGPYPRGGVYQPEGIAVGPDGVVYYADWNADYALVSALRFP